MGDFIAVDKQDYRQLVQDSIFLEHLYAAGVDSWEGYDHAVEAYNNDPNKEELED